MFFTKLGCMLLKDLSTAAILKLVALRLNMRRSEPSRPECFVDSCLPRWNKLPLFYNDMSLKLLSVNADSSQCYHRVWAPLPASVMPRRGCLVDAWPSRHKATATNGDAVSPRAGGVRPQTTHGHCEQRLASTVPIVC